MVVHPVAGTIRYPAFITEMQKIPLQCTRIGTLYQFGINIVVLAIITDDGKILAIPGIIVGHHALRITIL